MSPKGLMAHPRLLARSCSALLVALLSADFSVKGLFACWLSSKSLKAEEASFARPTCMLRQFSTRQDTNCWAHCFSCCLHKRKALKTH